MNAKIARLAITLTEPVRTNANLALVDTTKAASSRLHAKSVCRVNSRLKMVNVIAYGAMLNETGAAKCLSCPDGWMQKSEAASNCSQPPLDEIVVKGAASSVEVAMGWHKTNCDANFVCTSMEACPAGRWGTKDRTCRACPAGWSSFKGGISCFSCEKGKFAAEKGAPNCTTCDVSNNNYSDQEGATVCKVCSSDQMSIGFKCERITTIDTDLPIPSKPLIWRLPESEGDDGGATMNITWAVTEPSDFDAKIKDAFFFIEISTQDLFLKENIVKSIKVSRNNRYVIVNAPEPMCDTVVYVRIRAERAASTGKFGAWSSVSDKWLSTNANDCAHSDKYLDCSLEQDPLNWVCVKAKAGYWRDNRITDRSSERFVPREAKFVKCKNPCACLGALADSKLLCPHTEHNGTVDTRERCAPGYLQWCNTTKQCEDDMPEMCRAITCRQCRTCDVGYALGSDGLTCVKCTPPGSDDRRLAVALTVLVLLVVFVMFSVLVFLKVKSSTSGHGQKKKAAHSTIKRILLSHVQVIMLSLSLNVPWPPLIEALMTALSSFSSVSQHVAHVGCFVDTENPVLKQARFLYTTSIYICIFPLVFTSLMWEGIVVLRKLSVICVSSLMHDDALQLQFAFGIMVVNFALHHMYLPFDVNEDTTDKDKYLEEAAE
eukprot:g1440.t1